MSKKYTIAFSLFVALITIAGCTYGASVKSVKINHQSRTSPHIGDRAVYSLKFNDSSGRYPQGSGSMIDTVTAAGKHGRSLPSYIVRNFEIRSDVTMHRSSRTKKQIGNVWYGEDAAGNVYILGICLDGEIWNIVSDAKPPVCMPAKIKVGSSWKCAVNCKNKNFALFEYACIGKENLSTPMGNQDAYKLKVKSTYPGKGSQVSFMWVSTNIPPEFKLKGETQSTYTGSSQKFDQSYTLKSIEFAK